MPEEALPALLVLTAANAFLVALDTEQNNALTGGGIALQRAAVASHLATVRSQPDLANHPAFKRYLARLETVLPRLAASLDKEKHLAYLQFCECVFISPTKL